MISKSEIEAKAKEFEINVAHVEKDYVYGWLLFGIFTASELKDYIFLKGGNALRKGYFANTRYSADLDFGIPNDINQNFLLSELNKVCSRIEEKAGVIFKLDETKLKEKFIATDAPIPGLKVYEVRLYFKDFYGNPDTITLKISMDITRFDKVMLPLQKVSLIHPYSDATLCACEITCMKLEEIIATKLKCLMQRQHAPDLFDYAYSIKLLGGKLNTNEVVEVLIRKTIFSRNPQMLKRILAGTAFNFFRIHWQKTIICAKEILFEVDEAINLLLINLEQLFSPYHENGFAQFAFFAPEFRTPIIEAGRQQKLLKVIYKGAERIVEPYSLKYQEKRSGEEREYFYVFNRSGGKSEPGVRSFLPHNLTRVEILDETFEPQFPIELSKAGELPEDRLLFDPNRPFKKPKKTSSSYLSFRNKSTAKYIYQCSRCGKKFTRSSRNSVLRDHKTPIGIPCHGRHGIYITTEYH